MLNLFMSKAIETAKQSINEVPVGVVIVNLINNEIIATASNSVITNNNPTAHAEIIALQRACEVLNNYRLSNCALYTTLEPCPMCAGAIMHARIKILYFGAFDEKYGAIENKAKIFNHNYPHTPQIYGGIMERECKLLLQNFFKKLR